MHIETVATDGVRSRLFLEDLLPALRALDDLLREAVARAQAAYGEGVAGEPHRGLYIGDEEVERLVARAPAVPLLAPSRRHRPLAEAAGTGSRLSWLGNLFALSRFDLDVIVIALAPELDLGYERLYAYLQDDVTRRRPTVALALDLLCASAPEKLARRARFSPDAPLVHHGLLDLAPVPGQPQTPLLGHSLKLDERIVRLLLGDDGLDSRLAPFCRRIEPSISLAELDLPEEASRLLTALADRLRDAHEPLVLFFRGPAGAGKRRAAEALAGQAGMPLITVDLPAAVESEAGFECALALLRREARLEDAVIYLDDVDALADDKDDRAHARLLRALAEHDGVAVLAGVDLPPATFLERLPFGLVQIPIPVPPRSARRARWEAALAAVGIELAGGDVDALADRFRLTALRIEDAARSAPYESLRRGASQPTVDDVFAAARAQSGHRLGALARRISPLYRWDDIVLPADRREQLEEICNYVRHRGRVYDEWGFDRKLALGKGLNVLFAGPSGTGKTMAAAIIAGDVGLELYAIDLASVVSKYIGETEKNLARIFAAAESANAILFFDEADALFGKRSEVRDSHDRYANIEISYLLQRMEEYDGVAILATNLRKNMDDAFVRRMHVTVDFPLPDERDRRRIWEAIWPAATPREPGLDLDFLGRRFDLAGGNIRNIAVAASFLAATEGKAVSMAHVLRATRREYQKLGRIVRADEFGDDGRVRVGGEEPS